VPDDRRPPRGPFPSRPDGERPGDTEPAGPPERPRTPFIPPPPRLPREPFRLLDGGERPRPPKLATLAAIRDDVAKILQTQRAMALQLDGYGVTVNSRFDLFHEELALLRAEVTQGHAPRIEAIEVEVEETRAERLKRATVSGSKYAGLTLLGGALAEFWSQYGDAIEAALRELLR
jgi:hypothetical protein